MDRNRELTSERADGVASRAGGPSGLLIDAYREARRALRAELEHHPGYADLRQRLGLLHLALGEWPEAQASFEEALGIHPGYRAAYYGLRASLLLQGALDPRDEPSPPGDAPQTDEALWRGIDRAYRDEASGKSPEPEGQALPGLVRSHYAAAFAARRGDAGAVRRHLLEASRESATSARILAEAGLLRPEDQEIGDGALETLRSLLWLPFAEELYGYIGRTYAAGGMRAEAMASFDRAYLVRPSGAALACRGAEAAAHFGEEERVLSLLREAVAAEPGYARARIALGFECAAQGYPDEAREHLEEALRLAPGYADVRYNLGLLRLESGREEEGLDLFRGALGLNPSYVPARHSLASLLCRLGRHEEGLQEYERLLRQGFQSADMLVHMGRAALALGRADEALQYLERAGFLNPDAPAAFYYLGVVYKAKGLRRKAQCAWRRYLETSSGWEPLPEPGWGGAIGPCSGPAD